MKVTNIRVKDTIQNPNFLLLIALALSIFTYLWNPLGVIPLRYDEATYIGNAMHVLIAHTPQESTFYNHPYFGQLFLGGILNLIDYPNSIHPSAHGDVVNSVKMLWLVPRLLIGIIGVIDTFLVYKISERRYNTRIAFIAAILFAVMPVAFLRTIFLESLLLPFLLSSILFAVYVKDSIINNKIKNVSLILLSGIFMGLAIFTKIPIFMMIPLVGYLIFTNNKNIKGMSLWLVPVILIPLIWPAYAIVNNELGYWWDGIYYQTHRHVAAFYITKVDLQNTLSSAIVENFLNAPILLFLGLLGLALAAIKKDYLLLLWTIPFLVFLYFVGLVRDFHLIPILPALCISAARLIADLIEKIEYRKVRKILSISVISIIVIFGLINFVIPLIKTNNDNTFSDVAFVLRYLEENKNMDISTISTHIYSWIPKYVFQLGSDYMIPALDLDENPQSEKVLMVVDGTFGAVMSSEDAIGKHLTKVYNAHSKNGTTTVESELNKIIIPHPWPSNLTRYGEINLVDNSHIWKSDSDSSINISQSDDNLTILINASKTPGIIKHAFLLTQLKNLPGTPLILSLDYASKSPNSNTKYFIQIGDDDGQNRIYFKHELRDTSGDLAKSLFILPSSIMDKPLEFRLGIETNSIGQYMMSIKRASIVYPTSR